MNKICQIVYQKKLINITLDNGEVHQFFREVLGEFYLYENKIISAEELGQISFYSEMIKHYQYCLRILAKGIYATSDIYSKLERRHVSEPLIASIIKRLKQHKLLNDKQYAKNAFTHYFKQGYGPLYIKQKLMDKQIDQATIDEIVVISEQVQLEQALIVANKFADSQKNMANSSLLTKIYSKLTRYGYASHIAGRVVDDVRANRPNHDEQVIGKDYQKIAKQLTLKIDDQREFERVMIEKLKRKGYRYPTIRKYIEEQRNVY